MRAVDTLKIIGRPNAYYPNLAKPLGGVNAAVLFSQLFYWQDKATSELGVYKTRDELENETGLTHNEQRTAIKKLSDKGILIVTEKRLDHKTFYKIDNEKVNEILANFATSTNQQSRTIESNHPEVDNIDVGETINQSSLYQETTTEITTEITNNKHMSSGDDESAPKEKKIKPDYQAVLEAYQEVVLDGLPIPDKINKKRQSLIDKLFKEIKNPSADTVKKYFTGLMEQVKDKPFYFGGPDHNGWRLNFDYALEVSTLTKTREGAL